MSSSKRLFHPTRPEDPPLAEQVFVLCKEAVEAAGGYLVQHPEQHAINVLVGGEQVTITVRARDRHHDLD